MVTVIEGGSRTEPKTGSNSGNPGFPVPNNTSLEGAPPTQVCPSGGNLCEGNLVGVTGVGGDPNPSPLMQGGQVIVDDSGGGVTALLPDEQVPRYSDMVPGEVRRVSEPKVEQVRLVSNDRVRANVKILKEGMGECLVIRRRCVRHGEPAERIKNVKKVWSRNTKTGLYSMVRRQITRWQCSLANTAYGDISNRSQVATTTTTQQVSDF